MEVEGGKRGGGGCVVIIKVLKPCGLGGASRWRSAGVAVENPLTCRGLIVKF